MTAFHHLTATRLLDRNWIESELFPICDKLRQLTSPCKALDGRAVYCLFYEPSFLTRTSFERATELLGGTTYHTEDASQFFPVHTPRHIDNVAYLLASIQMNAVVLRSSDEGVVEGAAAADALPVINGGSLDDHPTQALADLFTLNRELGRIDGIRIALVGRLEHRNVNALLLGLGLFQNVKATLIPFSGRADPKIISYCTEKGLDIKFTNDLTAIGEVDAIYLNSPRTLAHTQLLRSRDALNLRIDRDLMDKIRSNCVILDPMQRSGDFVVNVEDPRLAFYRQAKDALFVRMGLLKTILNR